MRDREDTVAARPAAREPRYRRSRVGNADGTGEMSGTGEIFPGALVASQGLAAAGPRNSKGEEGGWGG
jgi:hypothetical protein